MATAMGAFLVGVVEGLWRASGIPGAHTSTGKADEELAGGPSLISAFPEEGSTGVSNHSPMLNPENRLREFDDLPRATQHSNQAWSTGSLSGGVLYAFICGLQDHLSRYLTAWHRVPALPSLFKVVPVTLLLALKSLVALGPPERVQTSQASPL